MYTRWPLSQMNSRPYSSYWSVYTGALHVAAFAILLGAYGSALVDAAIAAGVLASKLTGPGIGNERVFGKLVPLAVAVIHPAVLRRVVPPFAVVLCEPPPRVAQLFAGSQVGAGPRLQRQVGRDRIDAGRRAARRAADHRSSRVDSALGHLADGRLPPITARPASTVPSATPAAASPTPAPPPRRARDSACALANRLLRARRRRR